MTYGLSGHHYRGTLHVGLSDAAIEQIITETRTAPSIRVLDLLMTRPSFYGPAEYARQGFLSADFLLPHWADQPQAKTKDDAIDMIEVKWMLDVSRVTVCPKNRHSGPERDVGGSMSVDARIDRPVTVRVAKLSKHLGKILGALEKQQIALYVIAVVIFLFALHLWK